MLAFNKTYHKYIHTLLRTLSVATMLLFTFNLKAQDGSSCIESNPFCSDQSYTFPNNSSGSSAPSGPNYGCLSSQPNPIWYHLKIGQAGTLQLDLSQTGGFWGGSDIDFAMWGPFSNLTDGCAQIMSGNLPPLQCSYSASSNETIGIGLPGGSNSIGQGASTPPPAQVGEYYIVIMTNYSGSAGEISLDQTSGTGATDCSILVPCEMTEITATPGACEQATNTFSVTGEITFEEEPTTGTLIVEDCNGNSASYSAPFTSPLSYTITGINADNATCNVTAYFSDETACTKTSANYQNPENCECIPPTVDAGTDTTVCSGETIVLTATGATTYSWDNGIVNGVPFTIDSTTTYTVTVTNPDGCSNTDQIVVTVNQDPEPSFIGDSLKGCEPHTVQLTNTSNLTGVTCLWDFGDGTTSSNCNDSTHTYNSSGTYDISLTITDDIGCSGTYTEENYIEVSPNPTADFAASPMVTGTNDPEVVFTNSSVNGSNYIWDFGDNSPISTEENPIHIFPNDKQKDYVVTLIVSSGENCFDTTEMTIRIEEDLVFYIPNSFTPDSDGYNEVFQPVFTTGYDPQDFKMRVFNRWGEILFETNDASLGWDGTYGNKIVKDGTYLWKIEFKETKSDKRHYYQGNINLMR